MAKGDRYDDNLQDTVDALQEMAGNRQKLLVYWFRVAAIRGDAIRQALGMIEDAVPASIIKITLEAALKTEIKEAEDINRGATR